MTPNLAKCLPKNFQRYLLRRERSRAEFARGPGVAGIPVLTPVYPDAAYPMNGRVPHVGLNPYTPFAAAGTLKGGFD